MEVIGLTLSTGTAFVLLCLIVFRSSADYKDCDSGKQHLYGGKTVMLVVPHQDDDLNILGGVTEEFIKYGSKVYWVYTTNGDCAGIGETRLKEALSVADVCGLDEDDVIFLGYGDGTRFSTTRHIYNSPDNEIFTSYAGYTKTYALQNHQAYNDGNLYTRSNLVDDLYSVIMEYHPDIIFCNDYDSHPDHRATSLFLDEALLKVSRNNSGYNPIVLKSFAYSYTYYGYDDFYASINMLSTRKTCDTDYLSETNIFIWNDRLRLPVSSDSLSRYLPNCDIFKQESLYCSQNTAGLSGRITSGDRVFWIRRTDSVSYNASVSASSGKTNYLNDFKIIESNRVWDEYAMPFDGIWIPDEKDTKRMITFTFDAPKTISEVALYDNPALDANILDVLITFNSGNSYHSGKLMMNGSATSIQVDETDVSSVSIKILSFEGTDAGLSEIEFFSDNYDIGKEFHFVKFVDTESNFVYDYVTPTSGNATFSLYSIENKISLKDCTIDCSNTRCTVTNDGNILTVKCPFLSNCYLTVSNNDNSASDTIYVFNPGFLLRLGWQIETFFYNNSNIFG